MFLFLLLGNYLYTGVILINKFPTIFPLIVFKSHCFSHCFFMGTTIKYKNLTVFPHCKIMKKQRKKSHCFPTVVFSEYCYKVSFKVGNTGTHKFNVPSCWNIVYHLCTVGQQ